MDIERISISSGVNIQGKPFCHATCVVGTKEHHGQLTPDEVRAMALAWLEAAEAAEHDAAVFNELQDGLGLPLEVAGGFISALRARRLRADVPEPRADMGMEITNDPLPGDVAS